MKVPRKKLAIAALTILSACAQFGLTGIEDTSASEDLRPPNAEPGACYGHETSPAIFETITQHILTSPARYRTDGTMLSPATYRTDVVQNMVRDRNIVFFKKPCPSDMDDKFIASVQRALKVRGILSGRISGEMDQRTRRAVRKYQRPLGVDSGTLSLIAARKLGLVAVARQIANSGG